MKKSNNRKMIRIAAVLTAILSGTWAFTAPVLKKQRTWRLKISPQEIDILHSSVSELVHQSSLLLADAATATADAVAETAKEGGWWQDYLNIFKNTLTLVHSSIDEPLRDMGITQTWGISIALFTAGVRSLLIPLSIQQSKSAEYNRALKPYQDEIRQKFKDRKELMNRAIAKLYEDSGTNPFTGCLFSLLQIPVFLGLYRGITLLAKEGALEEPFLWIPSLEGPVGPPDYRGMDWLTQGWFDGHPALGWTTTISFLIMPIILVLGQTLTMKALTPEQDTSNMTPEEKETFERSQGILKFLPLMIGYFSLQVPAGLTIYWLTSNAFTLTQSLLVKAYYTANPPKIELPDYWDALDDVANMSPEERRKAAEAGLSTGPKFEDLLDEARFHYVVERKPLRAQSQAWERVKNTSAIPVQMEDWVNGAASKPKTEVLETTQAKV